jgi:hypothetical protein
MKIERPRLRVEVTPADLDRIVEAIAAGASYSQAAMAAGVRPSALRFRKQTDPAVALRLRRAWQEQARRLRAVASDSAFASEGGDGEAPDRGLTDAAQGVTSDWCCRRRP